MVTDRAVTSEPRDLTARSVTARFWDLGRSPRMPRASGASKVPKPCGDGPCGEVSWDFEVTAGSVTTPFWDPQGWEAVEDSLRSKDFRHATS